MLPRALRGGLSTGLLALAAPALWANPKLRDGWRQRLGLTGPDAPRRRPRVWAHGASAGDLLALTPTLARLRRASPEVWVLATALTASGHAVARAHPEAFDAAAFAPWAAPGPVRRTLARVRPDLIVLEYAELWPELILAARRQGVPTVLHNGRLSPGRQASYRALFALTGNLLAALTALLMRSAADAARARALGARPEAVRVTGNTKHDLPAAPPAPGVARRLRAAGIGPDAPVWVAGSTHRGEEAPLFSALGALRARHGRLSLVVVPRYVERAVEVAQLAARMGHAVAVAGALDLATRRAAAPDVLVVDAMGELATWYARAQVAFVGGSLVPRGGQNVLEPAARGVPTAVGPHTANFADVIAQLAGPGLARVDGAEALTDALDGWLSHPARARAEGALLRARAASPSAAHGAAARNAAALSAVLFGTPSEASGS